MRWSRQQSTAGLCAHEVFRFRLLLREACVAGCSDFSRWLAALSTRATATQQLECAPKVCIAAIAQTNTAATIVTSASRPHSAAQLTQIVACILSNSRTKTIHHSVA